MFDHPIVTTALGLVLFYVLASVLVSALQEWLASLFSLRAKNLRAGLARLLGEAEATRLYRHQLVRNLARGGALPSYLSSDTLAAAALDLVATDLVATDLGDRRFGAWSSDELRGLIDEIDDAHPLKDVLSALLTDGVDTTESVADKLADWFDEAMTRISGWYNRRAKLLIVLIALALTVAANASSVHLAGALWRDDALRTAFAAGAAAVTDAADASAAAQRLDPAALTALPLGWGAPPAGPWDWAATVLGWALTVAAVSLGAPFWFDLLGKVANLKGTGGEAPPKHRRRRRPRP